MTRALAMMLVGLAALPLSAGAQAGEEAQASVEHSLSFWHDEALKIALFSTSPAPSPETAPEEPALQLKLDDAGMEVAPTEYWPGQITGAPEETERFGEAHRRFERARIGFAVGSILGGSLIGVGGILLGFSYLCIGECPSEHPDRGLFNVGLILMGVGAAAMIPSGAVYGVRKEQLRRAEQAHYGTPRRVQWDLARSRLVF